MKNNRDMFIDLVEEIDPRHLEKHIKANTDTRSRRIKRYITAAGIYAAACIAVFLLIPYFISHTFVNDPPHTPPGAEPVTTAPVTTENEEEINPYYEGSMLDKVLDAAGINRKDVERLRVGRHQIVHGDVYYRYGDGVYKNTDTIPLLSESSSLGEFRVDNGYIYYTVFPYVQSSIQRPLYCYNIETKEKKTVCEDEILYFDFVDEELVYVTGDSENLTEYKVYSYDPETGKSELMHTIPAEQKNISSVYFNGYHLVVDSYSTENQRAYLKIYDIHKKEWIGISDVPDGVQFAVADTGDGYYCSMEWLGHGGDIDVVVENYNGVWYMNPDMEKNGWEKISDAVYAELYYVNGALVGVNHEKVTLIVEKPTEEEKYGLEEGKLFPKPAVIRISCKYDGRDLTQGDALYEYFYEKINARVKDGSLAELTDREYDTPNKYRGDKAVYVEFLYIDESHGAPFYPDKENSDTVFTPPQLFFPLTGDNTDTVLFNHRNESDELVTWCYGTLAVDPEIEAKILEFFSNTVTE